MLKSRDTPIPTQQERLDGYRRALRAGRGLTAEQWSDFDRTEKHLDPAGHARRVARGARNVAITAAAAMDIDDLVTVLAFRIRQGDLALPPVIRPNTIDDLQAHLPLEVGEVQILMEDDRGRVTAYEPDEIRGLIAAQPDRLALAARENRLAVVPRVAR